MLGSSMRLHHKANYFQKKPKGADGNSSGFQSTVFTKPGRTGFEIRATGWLCIMLTDMHTHTVSSSGTLRHTNTPKLDTWSVDAGAFPKGPRYVHLIICQLLMRASEWTFRARRETHCLHFHSSSKFQHTFPELLLSYFIKTSFGNSVGSQPRI